jgi:hypothetical protein
MAASRRPKGKGLSPLVDPKYGPVSTYMRRALYRRLKVYCVSREIPLSQAMEKAVESWLERVEAP